MSDVGKSKEYSRGRIWGPTVPMHLGLTNGPFVHRF